MGDLSYNSLQNKWTFYLHLHDTREWNLESYKKILRFNSVENAILLNDEIHYDLIKKSMMFLMKEDIKPMWEDVHNQQGGCFSFKVLNKDIEQVWKHVYFSVIGNTITKRKVDHSKINGITLSPKKKFCILKIWMKDCALKDPSIFIAIPNLSNEGCLFKKHNPQN
jgi:hypothetical protein|tara:strand:+ start:661 stop:1158 length:498 start_codon:yes stop_codon:yes gene_type:complete